MIEAGRVLEGTHAGMLLLRQCILLVYRLRVFSLMDVRPSSIQMRRRMFLGILQMPPFVGEVECLSAACRQNGSIKMVLDFPKYLWPSGNIKGYAT
jgi:hypothetical protein